MRQIELIEQSIQAMKHKMYKDIELYVQEIIDLTIDLQIEKGKKNIQRELKIVVEEDDECEH